MNAVRTAAFLLFCVTFLTLTTADQNQNPSFPQNVTTDDDSEDLQCQWKWSKWSTCTQNCGSGNTTRRGLCFCEGFSTPVSDGMCENLPLVQLHEVVPCNEFACDARGPCNKICWVKLISQRLVKNLTNGIFNCTQGCPSDSSCPKGKTYTQVLFQPVPKAENAEWYYLAKEWYSATLNAAQGVNLSSDAIEAINQAGTLLENCIGWGPDQIQLLSQVYATKEKLNRANNGIGGLGQVDDQVAILVAGGYADSGTPETNGNDMTLLILSIVIPVIVVILALVVIVSWVYYRRRTSMVVAHAEFPSEDDKLTAPTGPVAGDGDSASEEEKLD